MPGRLDGRSAFITGGASGIGREAALLFGAEGAHVVIADVADADGAAVVAEIEAAGGAAAYVHTDVSQSASVSGAIAEAERLAGGLNVLFNNAGIFPGADGSPVATDEAVWERVLQVNLTGVFLCCKYGIPALLRAGGGAIVNTASFVAVMGAATSQIAYTASKGGVLAREQASDVPVVAGGATPRTQWARRCGTRVCSAAARTGEAPRTISDAAARQAYSIVGSAQAGWFQFQPLYARIVKEQPDLLD